VCASGQESCARPGRPSRITGENAQFRSGPPSGIGMHDATGRPRREAALCRQWEDVRRGTGDEFLAVLRPSRSGRKEQPGCQPKGTGPSCRAGSRALPRPATGLQEARPGRAPIGGAGGMPGPFDALREGRLEAAVDGPVSRLPVRFAARGRVWPAPAGPPRMTLHRRGPPGEGGSCRGSFSVTSRSEEHP